MHTEGRTNTVIKVIQVIKVSHEECGRGSKYVLETYVGLCLICNMHVE
jgi:hypothetical protein